MTINYFCEEITFSLKGKRKISNWIKKIVAQENKTIGNLCYVFVSDEIILDLNKNYLKHDYFTDIITFDHSSNNEISGDMYISIDTVRKNAKDYNVDFYAELLRVMVHGLLHLCGYKDETESQQQKMRVIEDKYMKGMI